jgi:hypothetical protein
MEGLRMSKDIIEALIGALAVILVPIITCALQKRSF